MNASLHFRPAQPREAAILENLARTVWTLEHHRTPDRPASPPDFTVSLPPGRPVHAWVAETGRKPVAFIAATSWGRRPRLEHLWVLPEWQGHGVGRELVRRLADGFREAGWRELDVPARPEAAGFYRRLGAIDAPEPFASIGVVPLVLRLAGPGEPP